MYASLIVLEGKNKGCVIPLPETIFLIGRDGQCHLRPHCESVSQLHCAIAAWSGKIRVRDLKSTNGTYLNGHPIHGEVGASDGDELRIGTLVFALRIEPAAASIGTAGVDTNQLQWLLTARSDSDVLSPSSVTRILSEADLAAEEAEFTSAADTSAPQGQPGEADKPHGSKSVSAGKNLRAYFEARKRPSPPIKKKPE